MMPLNLSVCSLILIVLLSSVALICNVKSFLFYSSAHRCVLAGG